MAKPAIWRGRRVGAFPAPPAALTPCTCGFFVHPTTLLLGQCWVNYEDFPPWGGKPRPGVGLKQIARAPTGISKPTASSWGSCLEAHSTDEETEVGCLSLCLSHTITPSEIGKGQKDRSKAHLLSTPGGRGTPARDDSVG